jgi:molybdopterin synthase catalytic subunit
MIRLQTEPFEPGRMLAGFTAANAGAVASFTGLCRAESHGAPVEALELECYLALAEPAIAAFAAEAVARFDLADVLVMHRYGRILPGEPIVFVAAAAAHRRPVFDAVDFLMDRLKTQAPFWKKEHGPDGARWVEPRDADHADARRWEDAVSIPLLPRGEKGRG